MKDKEMSSDIKETSSDIRVKERAWVIIILVWKQTEGLVMVFVQNCKCS